MVVRAAVVGLFAALAVQASHALDFKGITVGQRHSAEDVEQKLGVKCGDGFEGMVVCNGPVTIAEATAAMNLVISKSGIVQRIYLVFSSDEFEPVRAALVHKFGRPASSRLEPVQNSLGAKFINELLQWNGKAGTVLTASKFAGKLDTSSVYFGTAADRKVLAGSGGPERAKDL